MSESDILGWPKLKIRPHPALDWRVTEFRAEHLIELADAVSKNPRPIQAKTATGAPALWDPAIEAVLRALADNKKAIAALNKPPAKVDALNRAVHYHVLRELHPKEKVLVLQKKVSAIWDVTDGQVKDDCATYGAQKTKWFKPLDAPRIAKEIINVVCVAHKRTRAEVLKDFDADMEYRARQFLAAQAEARERKKSRK